MNIVTLWLKVMQSCQKSYRIVKSVKKLLNVCNSRKKMSKSEMGE